MVVFILRVRFTKLAVNVSYHRDPLIFEGKEWNKYTMKELQTTINYTFDMCHYDTCSYLNVFRRRNLNRLAIYSISKQKSFGVTCLLTVCLSSFSTSLKAVPGFYSNYKFIVKERNILIIFTESTRDRFTLRFLQHFKLL